MEYEWDADKAKSNKEKHDIEFADSTSALEDPNAITLADDNPDEERFITIGMDSLGRIVVVVYTYRGAVIRIISARKATPRERKQYEES